jgi:hypothetical protein
LKDKTDQKKFIENSQAYWDAIRDGRSDLANELEKSTAQIVKAWEEEHTAQLFLMEMLDSASNEVRFFAAAYFVGLKDANNQPAVAVLEDLCNSDTGLISASASTILRVKGLRSVL